MSNMPEAPLSGLKLVVTRPAHLAHNLCQLLEEAGATVLKAPAIEIVDMSDAPHPELAEHADLARFCAIVFISRNAALYGCKLFTKLALDLSAHKVFAVGVKTANELKRLGVQDVVYPTDGAGSEALLAHPELTALATKACGEVLIVRGVGGSETLKEGLAACGVRTVYAEVYRRQMPSTPLRLDAEPDAVIAASTESLYNLYHSVDATQRQALLKAQAVVASEQASKLAAKLGFEQSAIRSLSATDEDMLASLCAWAEETKKKQKGNKRKLQGGLNS